MGTPDNPTPTSDLPHSRACGWKPHEHGSACSTNCPSCHGRPIVTQTGTIQVFSPEYRVSSSLKPTKREFRVWFKGGSMRTLSADNVRFEGSWIVFGDGHDPAARLTNLRAFSGVLEVEELAPLPLGEEGLS